RRHAAVGCLGMATVEEGGVLFHDVVEDDAAAEGRLRDGGDASRLVEAAVLQAERIGGSSLEARRELLLEPDGLVDRVVVALLRKRCVFPGHLEDTLERVAFLDHLPDRLEGEEAGIDEVAYFLASDESLLQDRDPGRKMASPEVDVVAVQVQQGAPQARVLELLVEPQG